MQEILTKIKKGMNFLLSQNCGGAVICHDASGLVSGIYPLCAEQSGGVYRRNCPISADLDRFYRSGICIQYKTAHGACTGER